MAHNSSRRYDSDSGRLSQGRSQRGLGDLDPLESQYKNLKVSSRSIEYVCVDLKRLKLKYFMRTADAVSNSPTLLLTIMHVYLFYSLISVQIEIKLRMKQMHHEHTITYYSIT